MPDQKPAIVLVDNSVAFTGAFKTALQQASLLKVRYRFVFVLPQATTLVPQVEEAGFTAYRLPLLEIKKSIGALLFYIPKLLINARSLRTIVQREGASLLVMNDFYNLLGVLVKMQTSKTGLVTFVRFLPHAGPAPLRKVWVALGQRYSDRMVAVSDAVLRELPVHTNTVRMYDAVQFAEVLPPKRRADSGVITFLYLANYIRGKGQEHALAAFTLAYKQTKGIRLLFAGGDMGLRKNKAFKQELLNRATANNLAEVVSFVPFVNDVEALMKSADIVLNFSEGESFSMTVAEACNYGLPVIATRCGGPEEIIVHGETGLLVGKKNIQQMCEAMVTLSHDRQLQHSFGTKGKAYVQGKFSIQNFISSCIQLYDGVMQTAGG